MEFHVGDEVRIVTRKESEHAPMIQERGTVIAKYNDVLKVLFSDGIQCWYSISEYQITHV